MRLMPRFATAFYEYLIREGEKRVTPKLRPLWEHPAGPKTIFFWSPFAKWTTLYPRGVSRPAPCRAVLNTELENFGTGRKGKQTLVIAGLGDISRPAQKLSVQQSGALCATGFIWSRYSLVIIPKNWSLFAVNFFVGLTGTLQLSRIVHYRYFVLPSTEDSKS